MKGNVVCSRIDGQIMTIQSVGSNPFDKTLSGYVVCAWLNANGKKETKTFHVDDLEFISVGEVKPYNVDENPNPSIW